MPTNNIVNDVVKTNTNPNQAAKDRAVPAAASLRHAQNYDEAPPGIPGPDFSARHPLKPAFNRGPSMLDYTAVTSAGPTPANEIPNPMSSHMRGSRRRESHLPDEIDFMRRDTVIETDTELPRREPGDEIQGADAFAPTTSRQETETGGREPTSSWEGTNDAYGSHS